MWGWLFKISNWQRNLEATVKRWVEQLRNQPVNEVWTQTQQWKWGGIFRKRSGRRLLLSVSRTLTSSFSLSFSGNWRKIIFVPQDKINVVLFNLKTMVYFLQLAQKIGIVLFSNGNKIFYNAEHLNRFAFSQFFKWIKYVGCTVTVAIHKSTELVSKNLQYVYQIRYWWGSVIFTFLSANAIIQHVVPNNNLGFMF